MAVITGGITWANGTQVTAGNLNTQFTSATFASGAVDDSTTALSGGAIIIKDLGVTNGKIAALAVTGAKIANNTIDETQLATTIDLSSVTLTLPDDVVATAKIADDNVTYEKVDTATQAEMEAESSAGVCVPDTLKYHPGVAKAYCVVTYDTSAPTASGGYNVAGVSEPSEDVRRISFTNDMANTNYTVLITGDFTVAATHYVTAKNVSYVEIRGGSGDATGRTLNVAIFGDLA